MKATDEHVRDPASPFDFWEFAIVSWIRLAASTAHAFAALAVSPLESARSEPDKERILAEEEELLLHVLE